MIELLPNLPAHIVGVNASGQVDAADYEKVLVPAVEAVLKEHGKVRLLYQLGNDFTGFTAGAMWDDMKLGLHKTARYYYYPGWHEPGTMTEFGFNKKAYDALPADLRGTLDHAAEVVQIYGLTEYHVKNAMALERLKAEFKGKVEVLQLPTPVLRDLKKMAAEVVRQESEKSPMARRVHASFTRFQAMLSPWDHVAEGAYHQFVAM